MWHGKSRVFNEKEISILEKYVFMIPYNAILK